MTTSERLYRAAQAIWAQYHTHPFVKGIGDGTLPKEKFQYFLLQDYAYLFEYAKLFALGVVKSDSEDLMVRFSKNLDQVLNKELSIHRAYMQRFGITKAQADGVVAALPNTSYTSYMLCAGYQGGVPEILASVLACSWSYAEIGLKLSQLPGAVSHPLYGPWIEGYAAQDYQDVNAELLIYFDRLTGNLPEQQLGRLEEIFVRCSQFELGFWDMAWSGE